MKNEIENVIGYVCISSESLKDNTSIRDIEEMQNVSMRIVPAKIGNQKKFLSIKQSLAIKPTRSAAPRTRISS